MDVNSTIEKTSDSFARIIASIIDESFEETPPAPQRGLPIKDKGDIMNMWDD